MKYNLSNTTWPGGGSIAFLEVLDFINEKIENFNEITKFIECGTGPSGGNAFYFSHYYKVFTIETNKDFYDRYKDKKGKNHEIEYTLGDGRINLKRILLDNPNERFLILLDDHNDYLSFIEAEMEIIRSSSNRKDHVIIVDDMKFAGQGTYPTTDRLRHLAKQINKDYEITDTEIGHNIHVIYNRREP